MNFKDYLEDTQLTESSDKVTIKGEQYTMKPVLSQKGDRHAAPIWHLVFFGKKSTIIIPDALTYTAGYSQGTNPSGQQWFLQTTHFGGEGNGSGYDRPSTPVLSYGSFGDWYVEALNGNGVHKKDVINDAEFVDTKMSVKDVKNRY